MAQFLNKSLYKRVGADYTEVFDDVNHTYIISFSQDVDSGLRIAREKLIKLMSDNNAEVGDYIIEVY
jgi:hypothetical protein